VISLDHKYKVITKLQQEVAQLKAELAEWKRSCAILQGRFDYVEQQRDALQASNARLREALEAILNYIKDDVVFEEEQRLFDKAKDALNPKP